MKTDIFCVFVVVLLVISPAAFGEIIPDEVAIGEGSSWGTCISVHANSSTPEDSAYGGGTSPTTPRKEVRSLDTTSYTHAHQSP